MIALDKLVAASPQVVNGIFTLGLITVLCYAASALPSWVRKVKLWQKYCKSHSKFSLEAGQGRYLWLEDPWSSMCEPTANSPYLFHANNSHQRHETIGFAIMQQ